MKPFTADERRTVLTTVHERITQYPGTHDQSDWITTWQRARPHEDIFVWVSGSTVDDIIEAGTDVKAWLECKTTACVAGHIVAAALDHKVITDFYGDSDIEDVAGDLLDYDIPNDLFAGDAPRNFILEWLDEELA